MAYGISVPQPGTESRLWQWKPGVLTTRSPGNSQDSLFSFLYCFLSFFYLFFRPYCPDCNVQYTIKKEMRVDTLAFSLITEESTHPLIIRKKVKLLSRVRLFVSSWTVACQAPRSMGFSRQESWSGLHFLLQGILPPRDRTQVSHIAGRFPTIWATREVKYDGNCMFFIDALFQVEEVPILGMDDEYCQMLFLHLNTEMLFLFLNLFIWWITLLILF